MKPKIVVSACVVLSLCSTGCKSMGPKMIDTSHTEYGRVITQSIDRQMLGNLVRLRYRENPTFLAISSITDNQELRFDFGLRESSIYTDHTKGNMLRPQAVIGIGQKPTISYTPIKGKEFIKQLMTPVPLNAVLGLAESGWKFERVFNTCVERINDVENAANASGPTPWRKPEYETFYKLTAMIEQLRQNGDIEVGKDSLEKKRLAIKFRETPNNRNKLAKIREILDIDHERSEYYVTTNFLNRRNDLISIRTRSLMGIMFYLSHAVEVPQEDIDDGIVQRTTDKEGKDFDWTNNASGTLLKIHCSKERPKNASVETFYRGKWFYIDDTDLHSKSTFMFVCTLFNLQAGEASNDSVAPALVLPID